MCKLTEKRTENSPCKIDKTNLNLVLREEDGKRFVFMVHIQVKLKKYINERGRIRWNITLQIILSKIL
jgi:hypothetical protein